MSKPNLPYQYSLKEHKYICIPVTGTHTYPVIDGMVDELIVSITEEESIK